MTNDPWYSVCLFGASTAMGSADVDPLTGPINYGKAEFKGGVRSDSNFMATEPLVEELPPKE